jgi:hypothetical protein
MRMNDLGYFDVSTAADEAFAAVTIDSIAKQMLDQIDTGAALPNALADRLLELIVAVDDQVRVSVVRDYLRVVQKRLERAPC